MFNMYRVLKRSSCSRNINGASFLCNSSVYHYSSRTVYCTSCRYKQLEVASNLTRKRNQSSCTNPKVFMTHVDNTTEIGTTNVNNGSSNVTKAAVNNLASQQMTLLTKDASRTSKQLCGIKKKKEDSHNATNAVQANNTKAQSNMINVSGLNELLASITSHNLGINLNVPNDKLFAEDSQNKKSAQRKKSAAKCKAAVTADADLPNLNEKQKTRRKRKDAETAAKNKNSLTKDENIAKLQEIFNQNLNSYIHVCVNCGYLNRAVAALFYYGNKNMYKQPVHALNDISSFNILMHGFASKGNLEKVNEMYDMIKKCNIRPTPQTFAACFECIARSSSSETKERLDFYHNELLSQNYTLDDLFTNCKYVDHQRLHVLNAVKKLKHEFKIPLTNHQANYSCTLVNHLNENQHNKSFRSPARGLVTSDEMNKLIKKQLSVENTLTLSVKSVEKPQQQITPEILRCRKKWSQLEDMWRMSIREAFARELKELKQKGHHTHSYRKISIYPYLRVLTAEQYVNIIMQGIRNLARSSDTFSLTLNQLCYNIGLQVKLRYQLKFKQNAGILQKTEKLYREYCNWYLNPETNKHCLNTRNYWQMLLDKHQTMGPSMDIEQKNWPNAVLTAIGKFLYNIMIKDIKIDVNCLKHCNDPYFLPAFYTLYRYTTNKTREELKPHPVLTKLFRKSALEDIEFDTNMVPMLSPPLPWTTVNSGGYIVNKVDFVRVNYETSPMQHLPGHKDVPPQQLYPTFDSLNQLSSTPWTVNEKILDLMVKIFEDGGSEELNIPLSMASFTALKQSRDLNSPKFYSEMLEFNARKSETYSLWCEALYKLSLANHFRGKIFWLPHNIDFRGRTYPVPPHLQHLGSDLARALLIFARSEPLGPNGLNWLKIHCINLTGLKKKSSINERLEYANSILSDILDSAENPLTGKMWWSKSDDPWQTLACCIEIKKALDSGNPETFESRLPIHQDGSCNGLQHYAALGRDKAGAEGVNLCPSAVPQDIYSCVVTMVEKRRQEDAENGVKIAKALEGFVQRKVIKQTIMTTVYGVTRYGARQQIKKHIKDMPSFPQNLAREAADYLVVQTFRCLREMFSSAREIQDWFTECARLLSQNYGLYVQWITPLGLPIIQPYAKATKSTIIVNKAGELAQTLPRCVDMRPDTRKQKNAFAPNFVHSLDSTHMILTSLHLEREGITFVSVHDCYWTHPCTVDIMNKVCRQQFVALHSYPILETLSSYFCDTIKPLDKRENMKIEHLQLLQAVPAKGTYRLEDVLESIYFFC